MVFSFAGMFFLTIINSALRKLHRKDAERQLDIIGLRFFYRPLHRFFLPNNEYEGLFFATLWTQSIVRFCYAVSVLGFLSQTTFFEGALASGSPPMNWVWLLISLLAFIIIAFAFCDYVPRVLGMRFPEMAFRLCAPVASLFLILAFPFTYLLLKSFHTLSNPVSFDPAAEPMGKEEIIDMIQSASPAFDTHDKKLIESVVSFKERIAREVMVPRVDVFSLPADVSIRNAANQLGHEGYSRIPVFQQTVDNIVGVLMYKDVLAKYMEYVEKGHHAPVLDAPIESIIKPVLHTPETKKISSLLQEFRKKQVHLAIVVDEYGGTEGIVTIEDILEEIVGDIADEYDEEQELIYAQADGSWIVDARMNILDAEELLGVIFPEEGEYDTIGGYIFHITGMIPSKGFVIHQDQFDMEILKSNERCVERVRVTVLK